MTTRIRCVPKTLKQYRKRQRAAFAATMTVPAECHSDDHAVEVKFDATVWFKQATTKKIVELAECGWGGDYPADQVAQDMAGVNDEVKDMFTYVFARQKGRADVGYECHVNEDLAREWLKYHRPRVFAKLPKKED